MEAVLLSKLGIFSYFYLGITTYFYFLLCLSVFLMFVSKFAHNRNTANEPIAMRTICFVGYGSIFVASVAVGLYDTIVYYYVQRTIPGEDFMQRLGFLLKPEHLAVENLIRYFFLLIVPLIVLINSRRILLKIFFRSPIASIPKTLLIYLTSTIAILGLMYLIPGTLTPSGSETVFSLAGLFKKLNEIKPNISYIYLGLMIALISISEEILFRGFVYGFFKHRLGIKSALILQSILFSFYHHNLQAFLTFSAAGILLALSYEQGKSLWFPIVVHMTLLVITVVAKCL